MYSENFGLDANWEALTESEQAKMEAGMITPLERNVIKPAIISKSYNPFNQFDSQITNVQIPLAIESSQEEQMAEEAVQAGVGKIQKAIQLISGQTIPPGLLRKALTIYGIWSLKSLVNFKNKPVMLGLIALVLYKNREDILG